MGWNLGGAFGSPCLYFYALASLHVLYRPCLQEIQLYAGSLHFFRSLLLLMLKKCFIWDHLEEFFGEKKRHPS